MKASELAFYFVCMNLAISMVNATDIFSSSEAVGEDYKGEDWFQRIGDFQSSDNSFVREGAVDTGDTTGLASLAINGIKTFVDIVLGAITGMGDLAGKMGMPATIVLVIDTLTILVYIFAIVEIKSGRGEA